MATRKKAEKAPVSKAKEEQVVDKTIKSLVFVSHDTRDADLAEEFSVLLKNASAGGLKSFRSSDKKGTQGIEYGLDWYPAIMNKIDEASDVVCLLTQRSVERPWILYEAGVAKGKLGKKVIGIAMGISHSVAFTGPFAQFQNNDGSIDAITKLVLDLVRSCGLDPDSNHVEGLVKDFHKKAQEILKKYEDKGDKIQKVEEVAENIVPKLFEEIKIMFENLPSKIEHRIDPELRRRKRRFHPMMIEDILHMEMKGQDSNIAFLMIISLYKDDFPWIYEIGLETYRGLKTFKTITDKKKLITNFERAFDTLSHPMIRDFYGKSDDSYFLLKESRHVLHKIMSDLTSEQKISVSVYNP